MAFPRSQRILLFRPTLSLQIMPFGRKDIDLDQQIASADPEFPAPLPGRSEPGTGGGTERGRERGLGSRRPGRRRMWRSAISRWRSGNAMASAAPQPKNSRRRTESAPNGSSAISFCRSWAGRAAGRRADRRERAVPANLMRRALDSPISQLPPVRGR